MATIVLTFGLNAAWIDQEPDQFLQPDGVVINVWKTGDEYHNWVHDTQGYTIIQDRATGYWCWAKATADGSVESTGYPVHLSNPVSLGLTPQENISEERYQQKRTARESLITQHLSRERSVGQINLVVVFIRFSDQNEFSILATTFDNILNNPTPNYNSMSSYYQANSYGQLEALSLMYPYSEGTYLNSFQSSTYTYYQLLTYSATNPMGYTSETQGFQRLHDLFREACEFIEDEIDDDLVLDSNGDGIVDCVAFVVQGTTGGWADVFWPHRWVMQYANIYLKGLQVWDYFLVCGNTNSLINPSTYCHEFGHVLGLPDFYRYNNNYNPLGNWDVMAANSNPPQQIGAHNKAKYTNWTYPIQQITTSGTYTLFAVGDQQTGHAFRINSPNSNNEYFVVEYRRKGNSLGNNYYEPDNSLPGSGLLVYRIQNNLDGNAQGPPDEAYIYRPGGTTTNNGTINAAYFSAQANRTSINDFTNPSSFLSNGTAGGLNIFNIGSAGETINFSLIIEGTPFINPPVNLTATAYETNVFLSWEEPLSGSEADLLCYQVFRDDFPISGETIDLFYEDEYLDFDTLYCYYVIAIYVNPLSESMPSNKVYMTIDDYRILNPPRNLALVPGNQCISLAWEAPAPGYTGTFIGYDVFLFEERITNLLPPTTTIFTQENLDHHYVYEFYVTALYNNPDGESLPSNRQTTSPYLFNPPQQLVANSPSAIVNLDWQVPDTNGSGIVLGYNVYRDEIILVNSISTLSYSDYDVFINDTHDYYITALYEDPNGESNPSNTQTVRVGSVAVIDDPLQYTKTELLHNYPNPFNPETLISFVLHQKSPVTLAIFNIKGEKVRVLVDEIKEQGMYQYIWNGQDQQGHAVATGIYFSHFKTDDYQSVKRMILLK